MLEAEFLGNSVRQYGTAAGAFLAILAGIIVLRRTVLERLRASVARRMDIESHLADLVTQIHSRELAYIAFYMCVQPLAVHPAIDKLMRVVLVLVLTYRTIRIIQDIAGYLLAKIMLADGLADASRRSALRSMTYLMEGFVWVGGALFALENLGVNISAMVAGLGITGVAVALAAQAILADLFSAISIYMDRPFVVGDVITVDVFTGTVERIGIKTTRVRALSGEMLVFSNSFLTSSKIRNFQHLRERRIVFGFGVSYKTSVEQVKKIPGMVRDIIIGNEKARLERVHFKGFGESALEFEVVYHVLDPDYNRYMDLNQWIHLAILEAFEGEGIRFAHPTRTLVHESEGPAVVGKA